MATPPTPSMTDPTVSPSTERPDFGTPYETWLAEQHGVTNLSAHRNHYQIVSKEASESFTTSNFWKNVLLALPNIDATYLIAHKYPLIVDFNPAILIKSWDSFFVKTYRRNILTNILFPEAPDGGWYLPSNWYVRIHDIVRTTIIVKYLDGVPLVIDALKSIADAETLISEHDLEARVDGYYGAHFNCQKECDSYTLELSNTVELFTLEVQITTQIKDVIRTLLHKYYEMSRMIDTRPSIEKIAWNYKDEEFIATYLGHILHYVEGMIIEVRDR
jgi:ppGpp synthetase/RelA/SpoT-type nucleotidyltranferase